MTCLCGRQAGTSTGSFEDYAQELQLQEGKQVYLFQCRTEGQVHFLIIFLNGKVLTKVHLPNFQVDFMDGMFSEIVAWSQWKTSSFWNEQ